MKRAICFFFIILVGCSEDRVEFLKSGCKPSEIETRRSLSFGDEGYLETYIYESDKLVQLGNYEYEYDGNKVSKIHLGPFHFEAYAYDSENRIESSKKYKKEKEEDDFLLTTHYNYEYVGNHISKAKNMLNSQEVIFYRDEETSNIDSLKVIEANGEIQRIEYFEYDENPNIYQNIGVPNFDFHNWIIKTTKNNILGYEKRKPNEPDYEPIGYSVDIIYNEFNYPSMVTVNFSNGGKTVRNISYVTCE